MYQSNSEETIKGDYAEAIVNNFLTKEHNYQLMVPLKDGNAHLMDGMAYRHISRDKAGKQKKTIKSFYYDVKAKEKMLKYNATGIDVSVYTHYVELAATMPFLIFFVDASTGIIYVGDIEKLSNPYYCESEKVTYPMRMNTRTGELIIFSLDKMKEVAKLTEEQMEYLLNNTNINIKYQ